MYKVLDDVLNINDFQKIRDAILSGDIQWHLGRGIVGSEKPDLDDIQFVHEIYNYGRPLSAVIEELEPLRAALDIYVNLRIKINITTRSIVPYRSGFHTDLTSISHIPTKTAVFYVNDNNGYTEFENGERVYSKANRAVIFDGNTKHSGASCTNAKYRCVINWNFL